MAIFICGVLITQVKQPILTWTTFIAGRAIYRLEFYVNHVFVKTSVCANVNYIICARSVFSISSSSLHLSLGLNFCLLLYY